MACDFVSIDGLCRSNDPDVIIRYNNIIQEHQTKELQWISWLISNGVKAAHPDDGWVDRNRNTVVLCYPQFAKAVINKGDQIALGSPDKFRLVTITDIKTSIFDTTYYSFEDSCHMFFKGVNNDGIYQFNHIQEE